MLLKAKVNILPYKKIMLICFLIILIICILSALLAQKFLYNKEIEKDLKVSSTITNDMLNIEAQLEKTLLNSITIVEDYLLLNPVLQMEKIHHLILKSSIDSIFIYDADGKAYFSSTGSLSDSRFKDYYENVPSLFERDNYYQLVKKEDRKIIIMPMFIIPNGGNYAFKQVMLWSKELNYFVEIKISNENIKKLLNDNIKIHSEIESFKIWTPSGHLLISTKDPAGPDQKLNTKPIPSYIKDPLIFSSPKNIKIRFSFGNIFLSKRLNSYGITCNNDNYFYTAEFIFSKNLLNKQFLFLRLIFTSITFLLAAVVYLIIQTFYSHRQHHDSLKLQASQVHHDIANPVQSLDWGLKGILREKTYDEKKILNLINQSQIIKGIIHDLFYLHDNKFDKKNIKLHPELLYSILESVSVSSNLIAGNGRKVVLDHPQNPFILINVDNNQLRRALLNLVTNAIQASKNDQVIKINIEEKQNDVQIEIIDSGAGIDKKILEKLNTGQKIESQKGRGMGFNYAKQTIEYLGGRINVKSQLNKGTIQIITLPILTQKPSWFINKIDILKYQRIIILDDGVDIGEIYKDVFKNKKLTHFTTVKDFEDFINSNKSDIQNMFFVIDYSVDSITPTGYDIIQKHNLQNNSILITSMYLETRIKEKCELGKVKLLPKGLISFIKS